MSSKNDDNALPTKDLVFILAIAGRIDAQSRILAEELVKTRHVDHAYDALDSLSSSYSMFKYFFDVYFGGSTDEMHEFMLSPAGIAGITLGSIFLVSFSVLACHFDKEKDNNYKKLIADAWPYFRDILKGLKNAYKGWRSVVAVMSLLGIADASALIIPIGITLGVLGAVNRSLIRAIRDVRKTMMVHNSSLFLQLIKVSSEADLKNFYKEYGEVQQQNDKDRYLAFLYSGIGGFIDALYLYVGVLTLTALAPYLLIPLASVCAFYTLASIVTRIYEEYEFQQKLIITQTKCSLAYQTKEIQLAFVQLMSLTGKTDKTAEDLLLIEKLKNRLCSSIEEFEKQRKLLKDQTSIYLVSTLLIGLKHGLYAYSGISSVFFLVSAILILAGVSFPPLAIALAVSTGLVLIAAYVGNALYDHYQHKKNQNTFDETEYQQLLAMKMQIEQHSEINLLSADQVNASLLNGLSAPAVPVYFYQEWWETIRSFFSGLSKGQKFVDFAGNPLQEVGEDGHYLDTPVMYILGALSALLFGFILALRALGRGFGRTSLDSKMDPALAAQVPAKLDDKVDIKVKEKPVQEPIVSSVPKTETSGESVQQTKWNDSPDNTSKFLPFLGFFGAKDRSLKRSRSNNLLNTLITSEPSTIQGLG